jgi:transcription initiation factor IIF auxiliary subunit
MVMRIESSLHLENDSEQQGDGWWKWSIWVEGSPEDLADLESVTYRLHPTFPQPVVRVTDPPKFKFSASGWGEFAISAVAVLKGDRTVDLEHWLELGPTDRQVTGKSRPSVFLSYSITDTEVATELTKALATHGVEVRTAEQSADAGEELMSQIERQLQEADAVVALVSDPPSRWVEQEALAAHRKGRFVLPVLLGGAQAFGGLSELARLELPNPGHVQGLARHIAARVKDHATPDEAP